MTTSANQIQLKGDFRLEERISTAVTLSPGHLVEKTSADLVQKHSTEGGDAELAFAVEDALQGKTIADVYAVSTRVFYHLQHVGSEVQAFLKAGENVVIGAKLVSAGDGTLIAEGSVSSGVTVKRVVAIATEALDLSASGDVDTLMDVRVL